MSQNEDSQSPTLAGKSEEADTALAGEAPEVKSILPRLLEVIEDRDPGSPGFGDGYDEIAGARQSSPPPTPLPDQPLLSSPEARLKLPHPPRHPDPTLDFFSMDFDPLKALEQPNLARPNMLVAPLNSVSQCRFILPEEMKESLAHLQQLSSKTKEDIEEQRSRAGPARVRRMADEWKESAVEKIAQHVTKGPLLLLKQLYFLGSRIRVVTRHVRGIRGSCTGLLKAFDKHMNLILQDVLEEYTVRIRVERTKLVHCPAVVDNPHPSPGQPEKLLEMRTVEKTRSAHKLDHRSRKLKQIFIRGSNIVMVCNSMQR